METSSLKNYKIKGFEQNCILKNKVTHVLLMLSFKRVFKLKHNVELSRFLQLKQTSIPSCSCTGNNYQPVFSNTLNLITFRSNTV